MDRKHTPWFLGIDLGTGSCKSVIVDEGAHLLGLGSGEYAVSEQRPHGEQDPDELVQAMVLSVRAAVEHAGVPPRTCQALSIGGAFHSLIAVDRSDNPLTGVFTWVDDRATKQARNIRASQGLGALYQQTGCPVHSMYPLYKIIFLREEQPQLFKRTARFISAKEYAIKRLTGETLVDFGIAAGTGLLNTHNLKWDSQSLALAGIRTDQLSTLANPRQVLKGLNAELAGQMGLPKDTPLVLGSADAVNSSLGAGAVLPGQATIMIGTSGAYRIIAPRVMLDEQARSWCYAIDEGHWLVGGAINNGGLALTWLRDAFNGLLKSRPVDARLTFEDLIASASQVPPGADGLLCLPFFAGERSPYWNMNARGVFFGLGLDHDGRHLARALMEGVAFRLRSIRDTLDDLGAEAAEIRASGGFTHSDLWPGIISGVLAQELSIPANGETSGLGAAFWAMLGSGVVQRFEDLHSLVEITKIHSPNPVEVRLYENLYRLYLDLYFQLGTSFDRISMI